MKANYSDKTKRSNIVVAMGLTLVIFGGLRLSSNLGVAVPFWLTSWPMLLILTGLIAGIKHQFKRPGAYVLILTGTVFLLDKLIPGFQFHELLFPLAITSLGIFLILRRNEDRAFEPCHHYQRDKHRNDSKD